MWGFIKRVLGLVCLCPPPPPPPSASGRCMACMVYRYQFGNMSLIINEINNNSSLYGTTVRYSSVRGFVRALPVFGVLCLAALQHHRPLRLNQPITLILVNQNGGTSGFEMCSCYRIPAPLVGAGGKARLEPSKEV